MLKFYTATYTAALTILGGVIGLIIGLSFGFPSAELTRIAPIIMGFDGASLAWLTRKKQISFRHIILILIGLPFGAYIGFVSGGMVGTILSFPFDSQAVWEVLFLTSSFIGMFVLGLLIPWFLIRKFSKHEV